MKPLPFTVAEEMVRLDPPVFERVNGWVWLLPTITEPRFMLDGTLKKPWATPVPEKFVLTLLL